MFDRLFDDGAWLYSVPAIIGTGVFVLKLALMMIGGAADGLDADIDIDVDADVDVTDYSGSTDAFEWLSIQTISGFLMGFGIGGLIGVFTLQWEIVKSLIPAFAFGSALVWLVAWLMKLMYSMQGSGNIHIDNTVGLPAVVYARIPEAGKGQGQIKVTVGDRMRIFNAVSADGAIESQARVTVVAANGDNSLTVRVGA